MSQPPRDPHRSGQSPYQGQPGWNPPSQQPYDDPYGYRQQPRYYPDQRGQARRPQPAPQRHDERQADRRLSEHRQAEHRPRSRGRRVVGAGLVLAVLGALVLLVSATLLPWVDGELSLATLWDRVRDIPSMGFGDWYVAIAGYPLVALGILLSFAAVLESAVMKVIWVALTVLGLGYIAFQYGIGPLTGLVGDSGGFSLAETAIAAGALTAAVVVLFLLKSAVGMFRRIAGLILLGLSGVHISAIVDLVGANGFGELSVGAYGPALGYLLAGAAAFVSPARLVPGR
ncbi:hypothetical protein ACFPM7_18575 [Actinokineospora guangxiensis]|uniref:Uncharacterized protein n=1 Tax=Actinokineospora guangxiensis TaxID=1490288 RepID=A0ABW0EP04_9PSEU